ncbi:hypothetical protein Afil01_36860 [Actinorhabdospora filicis]|uniref:DUF4180 domain-containing protein n=1 Tax=Actinorhabdospora filicis TaxID=1785913 RepID=A0A9W6SN30_9ACTN|nr:DUF4180 domain-containing protein [Actinorhabdospora filicis]GLZ78879.1 hypothetical protein Afil01_36860 [Actinorhabdospora filicis]
MSDIVETLHGVGVLFCDPEGDAVTDERSAVDLIAANYGRGADWVAVPVERLSADFFTLRTGVAGGIMQKFVQYRAGLIVLGDVSAHIEASDAFRDLVRESNRGRHVWFLADRDAVAAQLERVAA